MQLWDRVRLGVLGVVCAGVAAGLANAVLRDQRVLPSMPLERSLPALVLTGELSPPGWEPDPSFGFRPTEGEARSAQARYRSTQGNSSLQIEMRYAPDIRKMFTSDYLLTSPFVPGSFLPLDIRTHYLIDEAGGIAGNAGDVSPVMEPMAQLAESGGGPHWFWNDGRKFHLSAVICPVGGSVVTRRQFSRQLYIEQFHPDHLLPGSPPLFDPRSIIVDASVAQMDLPAEEARRQLEKAWHDWYPWCRARF